MHEESAKKNNVFQALIKCLAEADNFFAKHMPAFKKEYPSLN
jgi:hypothetical protein